MFELVADEADFVVINKADNCNFHSEDGEAGLVVEVERALSLKLYSVHRLDKMTSGILILAKSSTAAAAFTQLFAQRKMSKFYLALSMQKPNKKQGLIKGDMEKSRRGSWKLTKSQHNPAVTQFFSQSLVPGIRLYLLKPATGKTHQLRVALKSIAAPILGDMRYGQDESDRGYLHAYQLSFRYGEKDYFYQVAPSRGDWFMRPECQQQLQALGDLSHLNWPEINTTYS
ncbi:MULTISPECIES: TIGR01621 family pseudouridine synthase [unclassified Motilimonas]|uniref:TIGR01621 family pseudouridine synthase n=1 Tax=Motilimonas TaxID=1914248 RepID=UPI001E55B91E|nr:MULTISPECIES: TIGR01621 family pseudouridine synthase [unclassified Motilimonas]MCE0557639.1 TIGR01621 family pseudouridine synthase [Motilimonas sp. E26]MDO6526316.1 TIGR01621 family pseudouridine synthase [Motilimonas sp. 1_MG-2023]